MQLSCFNARATCKWTRAGKAKACDQCAGRKMKCIMAGDDSSEVEEIPPVKKGAKQRRMEKDSDNEGAVVDNLSEWTRLATDNALWQREQLAMLMGLSERLTGTFEKQTEIQRRQVRDIEALLEVTMAHQSSMGQFRMEAGEEG